MGVALKDDIGMPVGDTESLMAELNSGLGTTVEGIPNGDSVTSGVSVMF